MINVPPVLSTNDADLYMMLLKDETGTVGLLILFIGGAIVTGYKLYKKYKEMKK